MRDGNITKFTVISQEGIDPPPGTDSLALFNPDGSPYLPGGDTFETSGQDLIGKNDGSYYFGDADGDDGSYLGVGPFGGANWGLEIYDNVTGFAVDMFPADTNILGIYGAGGGFRLKSPDGTDYNITVANGGALVPTPA